MSVGARNLARARRRDAREHITNEAFDTPKGVATSFVPAVAALCLIARAIVNLASTIEDK